MTTNWSATKEVADGFGRRSNNATAFRNGPRSIVRTDSGHDVLAGYRHYKALSAPAVPLTFQELVQHDGEFGGHIQLTEFVFEKGYVVEESSGSWTKVFVPIFGKGDEQPQEILAVVESWDIGNEDQLQHLLQREQVSGILSADRSEFGYTAGPLLQKANPGIMLSRAWRIQFYSSVPALASIQASAIGCVVSTFVGCLCLWRQRRGLHE